MPCLFASPLRSEAARQQRHRHGTGITSSSCWLGAAACLEPLRAYAGCQSSKGRGGNQRRRRSPHFSCCIGQAPPNCQRVRCFAFGAKGCGLSTDDGAGLKVRSLIGIAAAPGSHDATTPRERISTAFNLSI